MPVMATNMGFSFITKGDIEVTMNMNAADGYLLNGDVEGAEGDNCTNLSTAGDIMVAEYYTADDWLLTTNEWTAE